MEIIFFIIAVIIAAARAYTGYNWVNRSYRSRMDIIEDDFAEQYTVDPLLTVLFMIVVVAFMLSWVWGVISIPVTLLIYRHIKRVTKDGNATQRRKEALLKSKVFLLPYTDIWRNLTLSNKYCSLKLKKDGQTIIGIEKKADKYLPYRTFTVKASHIFDNNELWNLFCINFSYNKFYEGLLEDCERFKVSIYEDIITPALPKPNVSTVVEKTDINNCSEAELTALPGISIVVSKKIIKKREEIGGFKDIEEFLTFVKLNPNIMKQLEPKVCVNKMKGSLKIQRSEERRIDL